MNRIMERYKERTPTSQKLYEEAKEYLPVGVGSTFRYFEPYPFFVERAEAGKIVDADGNEYVDLCMNYGAQLAGHAHPEVNKAIDKQKELGTLYTKPHKLSAKLAKELVKRFPVDKVRFTNSGTETTMHAVRLARGFTEKEKIIKVEGSYHGVHDTVLVEKGDDGKTRPKYKGVSRSASSDTLIASFNDLDSFKALFESYKNEIAGVLIEPVLMNRGCVLPEDNFLHKLLDLCHANDALLLLDEVKTGVKLAWGGACEYYDLEPDIVCLAKSIGGGLSIGAFGARDEIMKEIRLKDGVAHAGTYNANPLVVRAALATLRKVLTGDAYDEVFGLNERLIEGYEKIIDKYNLGAYITSVGECGAIYFTSHPIKNDRDFDRYVDDEVKELAKKFFLGMLNEGVIPHPVGWGTEPWTLSVQHTEEDIDKCIQAFDAVAPKLQEA
ncbi:aspartate aminotransferase family protein [Candidatus Bipolaricaulota bacterium]|nr:aspartate aminotransferase family protein [Candidatus Bipolaricaulota bacterium]